MVVAAGHELRHRRARRVGVGVVARKSDAGSSEAIQVGTRGIRAAPSSEAVGPGRVEEEIDERRWGGGDGGRGGQECQQRQENQGHQRTDTKVYITYLIRRCYQGPANGIRVRFSGAFRAMAQATGCRARTSEPGAEQPGLRPRERRHPQRRRRRVSWFAGAPAPTSWASPSESPDTARGPCRPARRLRSAGPTRGVHRW